MSHVLMKMFELHLRKQLLCVVTGKEESLLPVFVEDDIENAISNVIFYARALSNFNLSRIEPRPRRVLRSSRFLSNPKRKEHVDRLVMIEHLFVTGSPLINDPDLHIFSKRAYSVFNKDRAQVYLDKLRHGWGIYHLHLGADRRTDDLLFVAMDASTVFFIDIGSHYPGLYDLELVETLYRECPGLFKGLELTGDLPCPNMMPDEVMKMRNVNVSLAACFDGKVFMANPVATDGTPTRLMYQIQSMLRRLNEIEAAANDQNSWLCREARQVGGLEHDEELTFSVADSPLNFQTHVALYEPNFRIRLDVEL